LRKRFWERSARDGYFEGVMALDAGRLTLDYVGSEGGCECVDAGEDEKIRLSCHRERLRASRVVGFVIGDDCWLCSRDNQS